MIRSLFVFSHLSELCSNTNLNAIYMIYLVSMDWLEAVSLFERFVIVISFVALALALLFPILFVSTEYNYFWLQVLQLRHFISSIGFYFVFLLQSFSKTLLSAERSIWIITTVEWFGITCVLSGCTTVAVH
jgi:hypothetical protein